MSETIAVIGVGNMGSAFATNLLGAGYEVVVFDIDAEKVAAMVDAGADPGESAASAAAGADVVISSLPTAGAIEAAYFDDGGVFEGATAGTLLIEMSTTLPELSVRLHEAAGDRGLASVDAPVIGIPPVAEAAELVIMVGGATQAFDRAEPILAALGREVHHVGGVGDGHRMKLLNNMVLVGSVGIAAEAFALAAQVGVDREKLFEMVTEGMAGSEIIEAKTRKALDGDADPSDGSPVDNARKDLHYALEMGDSADFLTPITAAIQEHFTLAATTGRGDEDYSVLLTVLEELAGSRA